ncbi:MAG: hypothetical protein M1825_000148 [Sarcosagium campestre]|nr:MAG: hypothetical protein M1825_000148 [Sarcosagium campestre]
MSPSSKDARRSMSRKGRFSVRPFYLTILVILSLASFCLVRDQLGQDATPKALLRRALNVDPQGTHVPRHGGLVKRDEECKLVHEAEDKCAFIKANCPDEEAGLLSYLTLYYCDLPNAQPLAFTIIVLWLALLFSTIGIAASDFFCVNLSTIAALLGMSESMAGVTFLAFGNGSPDVFSTFAAMSTNSGSLAVGELIGAAGFITAVVAGSMAIVRPFKVARRSFVRDVGFFIVATCFSMVFLADGSLLLWECAVMVAFYIFYVIFVMVWHWWLGRRRRQRERQMAARAHLYAPGNEDLEAEEVESDEDGAAGERTSLLQRGLSADDFGALERGGLSPNIRGMRSRNAQNDDDDDGNDNDDNDDDDVDEEDRERWMAEINSNMRISRPPRGERRNTVNPIRPSLVGALEFRAVLSSLQRSRNIQTIPIHLRRYSDDPNYTATQQKDHFTSDSIPRVPYDADSSIVTNDGTNLLPGLVHDHRARAKSTNDAARLQLRSEHAHRQAPQLDLRVTSPPARQGYFDFPVNEQGTVGTAPASPGISLSPPHSESGSRAASPSPLITRVPSPDMLAPPHQEYGHHQHHSDEGVSPKTRNASHPTILIPHSPRGGAGSAAASPFPTYTESPSTMSARSHSRAPSLRLPPPSISPSSPYDESNCHETDSLPLRWWPYSVLPPPGLIGATIFPTLYSWRSKSIPDKILGVVAAPSVFLLSITLPVVESKDDDEEPEAPTPDPSYPTPRAHESRSRSRSSLHVLPADSPSQHSTSDGWTATGGHANANANNNIGSVTANGLNSHAADATVPTTTTTRNNNATTKATEPRDWNRWLICTQTITAPLFILFIIWLNMHDSPRDWRTLIRPTLFTLLGSLLALGALLFTTSPTHPPRYRPLICFFGFVVAITWISSIANEVVGALKALGVILGISDAILGLTVFAVGNSLGDLVANVTVARLGYQVMALSACFGGPMLNILLGIGIGGLWMTVREHKNRQQHHPGAPIDYKPYRIEVSSTLMISAASLLVTLVGLLLVVPWNGWRMDRKVGWGLVALWSASTVGNLAVEIAGWGGKIS